MWRPVVASTSWYQSSMAGVATEALSRVPLFADLDAEELQLVADALQERTFRAGETVTVEGEPGDSFYVVERGEAEVIVRGQQVGTVTPGAYFGEIALMTGSERAATIRAATDLSCYCLTALDFRTVVEGNPTIALKLMQSTVDTPS
jgi:CRP-like cAMP-binding protein